MQKHYPQNSNIFHLLFIWLKANVLEHNISVIKQTY